MAGVKMEKVDESKVEKPQIVKPVAEKVSEDSLVGFYPIKDLPSKYKLYPEGTMVYGRPLRVLEVKQLSHLSDQNSAQILNNIIKAATRGIKVEDLLMADKIYIIFWLRANTYKDPGYKVDFKCTKCGKDSNYSFSLDALDVTYLEDEYKGEVPFELPVSKDKVVMRYQRISDVTEMENFKAKVFGNRLEEYDDDILDKASCIELVNGEALPLKKKYEYIISLDSGDYAVIENHLKDIGVSSIINVKCSLCNEISYAGLSFRTEFFIPKYIT